MKKEDVEKKLENLNVPEVDISDHIQNDLKLSLLSTKKSARISIWLLGIPFLILIGALCDSFLHISIPPWSIIKKYGNYWPIWVRMGVFVTSVIIIPLFALIVNVLSITWMHYNREQKVLNISIKLKTVNMLIVILAGLLAFLFIGHAIADWIAGHD